MFFHASTFARSRGCWLNTRPIASVGERTSLASVHAMKETCVITNLDILPDFNLNRSENVA